MSNPQIPHPALISEGPNFLCGTPQTICMQAFNAQIKKNKLIDGHALGMVVISSAQRLHCGLYGVGSVWS